MNDKFSKYLPVSASVVGVAMVSQPVMAQVTAPTAADAVGDVTDVVTALGGVAAGAILAGLVVMGVRIGKHFVNGVTSKN